MVTALVLTFVVVALVISPHRDTRAKDEQERRKGEFEAAFNAVMNRERTLNLVALASPAGERQTLSFSDQLLFERGDARLTQRDGLISLGKVAGLLRRFSGAKPLFHSVKVNGHTDETPIATSKYPSNWHLSSDRATSVVYFLVQHGIPPERLTASGYAEFRPVDPYGKPITGMARQRRIEIEILYPEDWLAGQLPELFR